MKVKKPDPRELGFYFSLAQIGLEMVVPIGVGVLLDLNLGWRPWAAIAGAVLGFVAGFTHLISMLNRHNKKSDSDKKERDSQ
jgi:F0F1-type ATP synthase assembly protein I